MVDTLAENSMGGNIAWLCPERDRIAQAYYEESGAYATRQTQQPGELYQDNLDFETMISRFNLGLIRTPFYAQICNVADDGFRGQAVRLDSSAYSAAGYAARAEGQALFDNQYRGVEATDHSDIKYFGIFNKVPDGQDTLVAFFSCFQARKFIFEESSVALSMTDLPQTLPIFVISKLNRDPSYKDMLYKHNLPHRKLLTFLIMELVSNSSSGILVDVRAQPNTQRMLRESNVRRYVPGYRILNSAIAGDDQRNMLLFFPRMNPFESSEAGMLINYLKGLL